MRHVKDRLALLIQPLEQLEHLPRRDAVEVARRLVAHDELRVRGGGHGRSRHAAARRRQLCRQMVGLVDEPHQLFEIVRRALEALALRAPAAEIEWQHCVLEGGKRRQQLEELEHDADVLTAPRRQLLLAHRVDAQPVDRDRPGGRAVDPRHEVENRGLAAPRRAHNRHELARADREIDAAQCRVVEAAHAVDLLDGGKLDQRRARRRNDRLALKDTCSDQGCSSLRAR